MSIAHVGFFFVILCAEMKIAMAKQKIFIISVHASRPVNPVHANQSI